MNATQAENLRVLIRHMETKVVRVLDMETIFMEQELFGEACGTPACALGEATSIPALRKRGLRNWNACAAENMDRGGPSGCCEALGNTCDCRLGIGDGKDCSIFYEKAMNALCTMRPLPNEGSSAYWFGPPGENLEERCLALLFAVAIAEDAA